MNIVCISLARAVIASAAAAATALANSTCAGANPPPSWSPPWVVVGGRSLSVHCTPGCPPQAIPFSSKAGTLWFDMELIGSMGCGRGEPTFQPELGDFPAAFNESQGVPGGNETLTINSECRGGLPGVLPSWDAVVKIWYYPPPSANTGPGGAPAHTITGDVDLYDKPGGHGKKIGLLKKGDAVTLNGPCPIQGQGDNQGWCLVDDTTQNKSGAVWGDFVSK